MKLRELFVLKEFDQELIIQSNGSLGNFNVAQYRDEKKYPFRDIQRGGKTVRVYGPEKLLTQYVAPPPAPAQPAAQPAQTTNAQNDADSADNATPATAGVDGPADAAAATQSQQNAQAGIDGAANAAAVTPAQTTQTAGDTGAQQPAATTQPAANPEQPATAPGAQAPADMSDIDTGGSLFKKAQSGQGEAEVLQVQQWLNANGYNAGTPDGKYGNNTANAVRAFQEANGLTVDGDVGPATLAKMQEVGGGGTPAPAPQGGATASGSQGDGTRGGLVNNPNAQTEPNAQADANTQTEPNAQADANTQTEPAATGSQGAGTRAGLSQTQTTPTPTDNTNTAQAIDPQQPISDIENATPEQAAARIEALLAKAQVNEMTNLVGALTESNILTEALSAAEQQELQSLLGKIQGNQQYQDLFTRADSFIKSQPAQGTTQQGGNSIDDVRAAAQQAKDDFFNDDDLGGGVNDVDRQYAEYTNAKNRLQNLGTERRDELTAMSAELLNGDDYPQGFPAFREYDGYPQELEAIHQKYDKLQDELKATMEKLAGDEAVAARIEQGGSPFDKALAGDDDFDKALNQADDEFDNLLNSDGEFDDESNPIVPQGATVGQDGTVTSTTTTQDGDTTITKTTTSSQSSTNNVTRTGGGSTTTTTSGGTANSRWRPKFRTTDESDELKAQAKAVRKEEMSAFRDQYDKENPDAGNFDFAQDPGYEALEKKYQDLMQQARDAREMVYPAGEITDGKFVYRDNTGKEIQWDGEDHPDVAALKNQTNETSSLNRIKELAGLI